MILAFFILSLRFPSREVFQVHYSIFQIWLSSIEVRLSTCWSTQVFLFSYFLFAVFSLHVICFALCVYACVSFSLFPPTHSYFSLTLWSLSLTLSFSLFLSVCFLSSHFSFPLSRSLPSYLSISISFPLPLYFGLVHSFIHTLSLSLLSLSLSLSLLFPFISLSLSHFEPFVLPSKSPLYSFPPRVAWYPLVPFPCPCPQTAAVETMRLFQMFFSYLHFYFNLSCLF